MPESPEPASLPPIEAHVPELIDLAHHLAHAMQAGAIDSWQALDARVKAYFDAGQLARVDAVAPGWRAMSAYADGITLTHVMCVFASLLGTPEYQGATADQQAILKWSVLFHDIAKQVWPGHRDLTHGFRSAAIAARLLPGYGFATTSEYPQLLESWIALTNHAVAKNDAGLDIQDNRRLPQIIAGIDELFGSGTPAALIVKTVLLHMSITVVRDWPQAAPLTAAEAARYVDPDFLPLLLVMMLADNDGWNYFESATRAGFRQETLAVFAGIRRGV